MRQDWSHLLFLHWPVPVEAIAGKIPEGLEVDTFEGNAYLGLVPFKMTGVRPVWAPAVPWLSSFLEVNVRTYVHQEGANPGVWFFSLDAANPVAVWLARAFWHLPYFLAGMGLEQEGSGDGLRSYSSRRLGQATGPGCRIRYRPSGVARPAEPGTLEHFLVERYLLYAKVGNRLAMGQVHHRPYPVQGAELLELEEDLVAASGVEVVGMPPLIHFASGVEVEIFAMERAGQSRR
jgi:uncharacterized protein YqjF (DUF2071 family)